METKSKRESISPGLYWALSGVLGIATSFGALSQQKSSLTRLAEQSQAAFSLPFQVSSIDVGVTGDIAFHHVTLGKHLRADRLLAISRGAFNFRKKTELAEFRIDHPTLRVEVGADGKSNLSPLLEFIQRRQRPHAIESPSAPSPSSKRIQIANGFATIKTPEKTIKLNDFSVHNAGLGYSLFTESWSLETPSALGKLFFEFGDSEAQIKSISPYLTRAIALDGHIQIDSQRGSAQINQSHLTYNIDDAGIVLTGTSTKGSELRAAISDEAKGRRIRVKARNAPVMIAGDLWPSLFEDKGTFDGSVDVLLSDETFIGLDAHFTDLSIHHPRLSKDSLPLDASLHGSLTTRQTENGQLGFVESIHLKTGTIQLNGSGSFQRNPGSEWPENIRTSLELVSAPCAFVLHQLPKPLRENINGLDLGGTISGSIDVSYDRNLGEAFIGPSINQRCKTLKDSPLAKITSLKTGGKLVLPNGKTRTLVPNHEQFVSIGSLPRFVSGAFVAAEDGTFFRHNGFDLRQIERSLAVDAQHEKFIRGGSTITQQLAKNLFLTHERTFARKIQEAVLAWRLEDELSKSRLLEIYLNIIELSDQGDYGLVAASKRWFNIHPKELSIEQVAFLSALTREPTTMGKRVRAHKGLDEKSLRNSEYVLRALKRDNIISSSEYTAASSRLSGVLDHLN